VSPSTGIQCTTQTYADNRPSHTSEGGTLILQNKVVSIIKQEVIQPVTGVDESHQKEAVT